MVIMVVLALTVVNALSLPPPVQSASTPTVTASVTGYRGIIPTLITLTPTATIAAVRHVVQSGDSLSQIATRYGVSMSALLATNGLSNPEVLYVGQVLIIPTTATSSIARSDNELFFLHPVLATLLPTQVPNRINGIAYSSMLVINEATRHHIRDIFHDGQARGRNAHVFSRLGDSTIEAPHFLTRFDGRDYHLGAYHFLQSTINYYHGSFSLDNVSVMRGLHTWSVFDPMWTPRRCEAGEHLLACEFRLHNPSLIFIRLGSNDRAAASLIRDNFEAITRYCIDQGVIPILGTKADHFERNDDMTNDIIRDIAHAYDVPLWDFDQLARTLENRGLGPDQVHLTTFYSHDWRQAAAFRTGHGLHNLSALVVLDSIRQIIQDD